MKITIPEMKVPHIAINFSDKLKELLSATEIGTVQLLFVLPQNRERFTNKGSLTIKVGLRGSTTTTKITKITL